MDELTSVNTKVGDEERFYAINIVNLGLPRLLGIGKYFICILIYI